MRLSARQAATGGAELKEVRVLEQEEELRAPACLGLQCVRGFWRGDPRQPRQARALKHLRCFSILPETRTPGELTRA